MHLYRIEIRRGDETKIVDIEAKNRTQAASIARKGGWEVCWVNMIG